MSQVITGGWDRLATIWGMKSKVTQGSLIMGSMLVDKQETWDTRLER